VAGNDVFLFPSALPGANDVELNAEPSGGPVGLALAVTEGADTADFALSADSTPLALAATEGADTAAVTVNVTAAMAVTDGADSAAANVTVTAALAVTDGADSAAVNINVTAALAITEGADTAAASINATAGLAATEGADTADFSLEAALAEFALAATEGADTASFDLSADAVAPPSTGGGFSGAKPRRERPPSARKLISYEDTIVLERVEALVDAIRDENDPILACEAYQESLEHELNALRGILAELALRRAVDLVTQKIAEAENLLRRKRREAEAKAQRDADDDFIIVQMFALAVSRRKTEEIT
jgi:hypothetical protein